MHKQYTYMDADWNNLEVLQRNRLKTRPFLCGFSNLDEAYRKETANLRSLNGQWNFMGFDSPFDSDDQWIFPLGTSCNSSNNCHKSGWALYRCRSSRMDALGQNQQPPRPA